MTVFRPLDGSKRIDEVPGSKSIRYCFEVPQDLPEAIADMRVLTDGGCDTPDIRNIRIRVKPSNGEWTDITEPSVISPPNGEDDTSKHITFPDPLAAGTRICFTIDFDDEFETGEYIVFRPSFDDGSVLGAAVDRPSAGDLAMAVFKRTATAYVADRVVSLALRKPERSRRLFRDLAVALGPNEIVHLLGGIDDDWKAFFKRAGVQARARAVAAPAQEPEAGAARRRTSKGKRGKRS